MKKILVAFALAAVASSASALLANSRHDFMTNGYYTSGNLPDYGCAACHTPHNATMSDTIIWARADFSALAAPTVYTGGGTVSARGVQACLTCHATGTTATTGLDVALGAADLTGTDLRNDHPVGSGFVLTAGSTGFQATITLQGAPVGQQMTCASCHDVHNSNAKPATKLLRNYTGTDFCVTCHAK